MAFPYDRNYHSAARAASPRPGYEGWRSARYLDPAAAYAGSSLYRTRSVGQAPVPVVNVYNEMSQDAALRADNRSSPYLPAPYPPSADYRGRPAARLGEELLELELVNNAVDRRMRLRSRGRSDVGPLQNSHYAQWQLMDAERRLQEDRRWHEREAEERRYKTEWELKAAREAARRKLEEEEKEDHDKRVITEWERKKAVEAENKKKEEQELRERIEREKAVEAEKKKKEEQELRERIEREKREKKEREDRDYLDFLRIQKEKKEEAKAKQKAEEEKLEEAMRKRLSEFGFSDNHIQAMLAPDEARDLRTGLSPRNALPWTSQQPVYAKIHRDYISIDTLVYYDIPYEYDRDNPDYLIILREMDKHQTDLLLEHTRRLRGGGRLLLEEKRDRKSDLVWVRKRARSKSTGCKEGIFAIRR